jgi:hypothetical protein
MLGVAALAISGLAGLAGPLTARAAPLQFYFHGTAADDANRAAGTPTATFDTTAPTGTIDHTQTGSVDANANFGGNPLSVYWISTAFTGTINGSVSFDWWWSTGNAAAIALRSEVTVTFHADASPSNPPAPTGTKIGQGKTTINLGPTPVENKDTITGVNGTATRSSRLITA